METVGADGALASRLNWLRASVLGANDGIISTAGLVIGVAAASATRSEVATAGVAGLVAGAVSMALGEFVSVSTQRDTERAIIAREKADHEQAPHAEHQELVEVLRSHGLSHEVADDATHQLEAHDALGEHLRIEYGIHQANLANPWVAAGSSAVSFSIGALLPLLAAVLPAESARIWVTVVAVVLALCLTGYVSARLGGAPPQRAIVRLVVGGLAAMAVTYAVGNLIGSAIA
jgi:VIT1/CCC1 family predicted Fe2+/Mn2+ transporter